MKPVAKKPLTKEEIKALDKEIEKEERNPLNGQNESNKI